MFHSHGGVAHAHIPPTPPGGAPPLLHVRGVVLPEGEERDLWLADGRISETPLADCVTLAAKSWIVPGLVDAHCHVGMVREGAADRATAEDQARADRDAGTLLIRDAGSPADTHWLDESDEFPDIIRAGRHIARTKRYQRGYAAEVEPEDLVAEVRTQARRGDGWVKLVGDWIDRQAGDLTPLWDPETARAAIDAAHEEGAKVTAHCFGEQAPAELVAAGIDGIEHGTGLDGATIQAMADRGVPLVPTLDNIEIFPGLAAAGEAKFPRYAAHLRDLYARRDETVGQAIDAGVPVYAGTDAGGTRPHGTLVAEIEALARVGGAEFALGAASWRARDWLGRPALHDGAPADLIVLATDPRQDLATLRRPLAIILKGHVVAGHAAG
ncbi:MAG: amidohydrolase family protein [Propionibacteriaceae bacterium]|jgi:imidazolonepropionase-like amidohydrolase|nr:amidohydrolase family protein [Propionibacteriaceae bacterium]